jgi:tetraacyldisaccharide 4'-kinase
MREPRFWGRPAGLACSLLSPAAAIYGALTSRRMRGSGRSVGVPVICIGNPTLGGAGKTPTAIAVARMLQAAGRRPFLLSRGYGGAARGPLQVDVAVHRATEVGDEPMLLARVAPTIVARNRVAGAALARASGADVIVMDDGFQNPSLHKDLSILVVDGGRGVGNGLVCPAGPLRAPLVTQLAFAHALMLVGDGAAGDAVATQARARGLPVFHARLAPDAAALAALRGRKALAFAGIAIPDKFFATLADAGIEVRAAVAFPDHHRYRRHEALDLIARAEREDLVPVTTEKDEVRLFGEPDVTALARTARALPVTLEVEERTAFRDLLLTCAG